MPKPAAALPADLLLLLNDLEHVLSFNGLKGNQHTRYIADEIQAKAESRDVQDQGKLDQHARSRKRANELLLKHEAYEMCFDAFFQSCTMHQPSYQAAFQQKLWQHVMQLLEEWQDLHEQQQMQMKSLALDHLHLKHDYKALHAKLKTLKLTVQTLLSDVSALLHHATSKDSSSAALPASPSVQDTTTTSSCINSNASSRSSGSWQLQLQQSSSLPNAPARRSSDIVNSLIKSIEKMTRQFAECKSGRLAAAADSASRAAAAGKQQYSGASDGERAAAAAASSTSSTCQSKRDAVSAGAAPAARLIGGQLRQPSTTSSSSSAASSGLAAGQLERQVESAAQMGTKPKAGMPPLAPTELLGKHTSGDQQVADSPVRQKGRNVITARSLSGCAAKRHKQHGLAGASPHRSHPPSAFDSSLAWFMQNAESSSSSSNSGTITGGRKPTSKDQAMAAAIADTTPGKGATGCQSAAGSTSQPQISIADVKSAGTATTQAAVLPASSQSSVSSASEAAAQPEPAQASKQEAVVPSSSPALAASNAQSAVTPVAEAATTPALTAANGAHLKQQQPEWIATLMQQPDALQKVRAAVRFALSPGELELEPSVAEWASEAGATATVASAAAAAAEKGAAGRGPTDVGKAAAHIAQARWGGSGSAVAANVAPATSSASNNSGSSCSNTNSSSSQKKQSMQSAGELSLMNAAAAVAEQQGHSLSTAPRAGRPGYALASATDLQLQQMPIASRFTHLQQHQQQRVLVQVRSDSADAASKPSLQLQNTASSSGTKRPASSHEARSGVGSYGNGSSSSSNGTATAAMMGRSRSAGPGFSPLVPAGGAAGPSWPPVGAAAGPLTAALQRQTSLQKHPPAPTRPTGPFRQKAGTAVAAGANPPVAFTAVQRQAAGSAAEHSRLGGTAGAAAKHRPPSAAHSRWGTAVGGGDGAAVVAGAISATSAGYEDGASAAPWSRDRDMHASVEQQQQQGSSQRLMRKQDVQQQQQQQQYMAAVPEGQIADAVEGPPSDAMGTAANKAFSMVSSSVGSDMVRLGSCNAGFWTHGSACNNGSSSPPEQSTASQTNSPLVAAAGEAATTLTVAAAAADECGVAALLSSVPATTMVGVKQTLSQSKQGARNQALAAPAMNKSTAQTVQQVAPRLEKSVSQQPASAAVPADGVGASAADTPADHNIAAAGGNTYTATAKELAGMRQQQRQQQQQHGQAADGTNSHSLAAAELKAEGSSARAEAYSGLITAAAAAASASEDTNQPAAAAASTAVDPASPTVPAGEHVTENVQELPDVIKSAQRCDSPRKQPRSKAVAAAAALPSGGAISTAEQWTSTTASEAPSGSTTAVDVAQQAGQGSAAASAAAAAAREAPSMSASGDKRTLQCSRNSLSSSVQAQLKDDWAVRAMQSKPAASSSPDDNSLLSPLCKRLRSSLVLLDTALSVLTQHEGTTSDRHSHSRNAAAAAAVSASDEVHSAGVAHTGLVAKHHQSPCIATSEVSHTQELLQQQQQADRTAQQQPQQHLQHTVRATGHRLNEDGGHDVGLVRDRDKSADSSKLRDSSATAGNATRITHNGTNTAAADNSHRALKGSSSSSRLEASSVAVEEEPVAAAKSGNAAVAAAESVASSADSVVASSADSSDIISTATERLADLAGTAVAASAPAVAAATTETEPEQLQVVPEASSSIASPDAAATLAAAEIDTLAHHAISACPGVCMQAIPAAAAGAETTCAVATCTPPPQLPDKGSMTSSLELAGPAVLCPSPDLAGALGGTSARTVRDEAAAADGACGGDLSFSLDELVAILIDVMNSKQEQDDRLSAAGLLCHTPTAFLQRYLAAKVHGDKEAYGNALNALLSGLDAHKQDQPEVAVFCRILAGDVEEHYFDRHLNFRSQLQHLVTQACEQSGQQQNQHTSDKQQLAVASWAACSSMQLHQQQLLWLLDAWSRQRAEALAPDGNVTVQQLQHTQREWWAFIRQRCCSLGLSADSVVSALLFWELQQHVVCLQTTVEAFRAADQQHSGLLDLEQFRVFCSELNDSMSNEEVLTLWAELDKLGHGAVTFSTICSCLLPAMNEA